MKNVDFFKKENLKDGMMVKYRNYDSTEQWFIKFKDKLLSLDGYNSLSDYNDNLECTYDNKNSDITYNIIEIGEIENKNVYSIEDIFDSDNINIIASRDKAKDKIIRDKISKLEEQLNKLKKELGE